MRTAIVAIIALLVGLTIGHLGPRGDLRKAQDEIRELKKSLEQGARRSDLAGITSMLHIDPANQRAAARRARVVHKMPAPHRAADGLDDLPDGGPAAVSNITDDLPDSEIERDTFEERIDRAIELWQMRVDVARKAFNNKVSPRADAVADFDILVDAMNIRLATQIEAWVDVIKQEEQMSPENGLRMMNDLSDAIVTTYEELDRNMEKGWRANAGEDFTLMDFIDPEVARPLGEIEGVANSGQRGGPPWADRRRKRP